MKFFVVLEIFLIAARITVSFFDVVPGSAQTALTWACIVIGIIALVFVGVRIYRDLKGR